MELIFFFFFYACPCDLNIFTQRLIKLLYALFSLWVFKMPQALLHKSIGVPLIPGWQFVILNI